MNSIILYISLFFLCTSGCVYGQSCITNDRFANACPDVVYSSNGCPTWTDACGDGWIRSHGTPNLGSYEVIIKGQTITRYYAYMWSTSNTYGEGMYTPYLFQKGHSYDVTLEVFTTNADGSIKIYAANGLQQGDLSDCGGTPPGVFKAPIAEYPGWANGWTTIGPFVFTNNTGMDLTQIWIYPEGSGGKYEMGVDWVEVCPSCDGDIVYNSGVVPTGITKVGTISAGSTAGSGGSGTVTVDGAATTNFYATKEINLLPEFDATVGNGTFTAEVYECYLLPPGRMEAHKSLMPSTLPTDDLQKKTRTIPDVKMNVYPSVGTGLVYVTGSQQDLENVELTVYDQLGRKMLQVPKNSYSGKAMLDLSKLNNGVYLLQIRQPTKTTTQKIIIQK